MVATSRPPAGGWDGHGETLSMRKTRGILRLKWARGRTHREVARRLGISVSAVGSTVSRVEQTNLDWTTIQGG